MPIRAGLINGVSNLNRDHQIGAIHQAILDGGVISGLEVTTGQVGTGTAIVRCVRTSTTPNEVVYVSVDITTAEVIDTTGTKKVWLKVTDANVNDPSLNTNASGTGIAVIQTGVSYPAGNFVPLADITSGVITDERQYVRVSSPALSLQSLKTVRCISTTNLTISTLNNGSTVDSVTVATGDIVLLAGQSTQSQNGLYEIRASGGAIRARGGQRGDEILRSVVIANDGALNIRKCFVNTNSSAITVGSTNITYQELSITAPTAVSTSYTAGETISAGQVLAIDNFWEESQCNLTAVGYSWGASAATTRIGQEITIGGNAITVSSIQLRMHRFTTPSATLITVRIETDSSSLPSGTLADANATLTFDPATLTTSLADYTFNFPASFTLSASTVYHVVLSHNGAVAAANDFRNAGAAYTATGSFFRTANAGSLWNASWSANDNNIWFRLPSSTYGRAVRARSDNIQRLVPIGIATSASTNGNPVTVAISGASSDLSGLTANERYFVTNTPGTVGLTPGNHTAYVGDAVNATTLTVEKQPKLAMAVSTGSVSFNTTTATNTLVPTLRWTNGGFPSLKFPANYFIAGKALQFRMSGTMSLLATNTFTFRIAGFGFGTISVVQDGATAYISRPFSWKGVLRCTATGVSGTMLVDSELLLGISSGFTNTQDRMTAAGSGTFNTTIPNGTNFMGEFSASSGSNSITVNNFILEELN